MRKHQKSLVRLIRDVIGSPESGAEIGVHRGELSAVLRSHFPKCHMHFVDSWKQWDNDEEYYKNDTMGRYTQHEWERIKDEAIKNIEEADGGPYKIFQSTSKDASLLFKDNTLDFVFIDANHAYESVKEDIELWLPKTKRLICGHDYKSNLNRKGIQGTSEAVDEIFGAKNIITRRQYIWAYVIK